METAVNPSHGAATGEALSREGVLQLGALARAQAEGRTLRFAQLGARLGGMPDPLRSEVRGLGRVGGQAGVVRLGGWVGGWLVGHSPPPSHTSPLPHPRSQLWRDLTHGPKPLYSEHLAYVAAFAVGAELVHGDRPKRVT